MTVKELGMARASDEHLVVTAREANRLFVTRDKDFGSLLFMQEKASSGVIFLRISPKTATEVHRELLRILQEPSDEELKHSFCVVEPGRHRIRHLQFKASMHR